jgi:iron complex outermembrane receptor protein
MKRNLLFMMMAAACLEIFAQTDTASVFKEITIEEKRLSGLPFAQAPRNIQVINRDEILALPAQSVAEVLTWVAGVDLRQRGPQGAQADLTILGSTFEQVLVLIDGIPMRDAQTGHLMMNLPVDIQQIERIEIIKGTAARIYGANALAGAVNLVTREPASENVVAQLWMGMNTPLEGDSVKSYLQAGGRLSAGWKNDSETQRHQIDASYFDSEGYRYNSSNTQQRLGYRGSMSLGDKKSQLNLAAGIVRNETGANGYYAYPFDVNAFEVTETVYSSARYRAQFGSWNVQPLVYMRYSHDDYIFIREQPEVYRNNHFNTAAGAELHVSKTNRAGQFGGGYESRAEVIHSNNLGHHNRFYHSFYGEQRLMFENSTVVVIGAMAQFSNVFGLNVYPGLEFSTPLAQALRLFGNLGLGSRNPSFTDLYYSDRANQGNPSLKPEQALNAELGLKWNDNKLQAQTGGFIRRTSNFIDYTRASEDDLWMPENFQLVTISGADSRIRYRFDSPSKTALESVSVAHTVLFGQLGDTTSFSKYALSHLRHQLVAQARIRFFSRYHLQLVSRYIERINSESYQVYDLRLGATFNAVDVAVDVNNVLNETYIESGFVPMPGRVMRASLTWKWNQTK